MLLAALAFALVPAQAAVPPVAEAPVKEKKICRQMEQTGSIMGARICHTKTEWTAIDAANQKAMDNYHDRSVGRSGVNGGS